MKQQFAHVINGDGTLGTSISIHYALMYPKRLFVCGACGKQVTPIAYAHDPESDHFFHLHCEPADASLR